MTGDTKMKECYCCCFNCSENGGFNHCQDENCYTTKGDKGNLIKLEVGNIEM